jgi:transcriptional regulator with XRE-family HTH domain
MSNLKKIREEKNISQSKLAEISGVNLRTLQDYEQGSKDINGVRGITLYKLAQALKCKIEDLLEIKKEE